MENLVKQLLIKIGENPDREGLKETPSRFTKAFKFLCSGYEENPSEILSKTFTQQYDEIVLLKDIELYSTCEHHLLPFFGRCHIAYIPDGKVVGISKLARLMECYARRLQIQERLCNQIVEAIEINLKPKGSACVIEAQHFCMSSRGIQKQHSKMVTSAIRGAFKDKIEAREELMRLISG